MNGATAISKIEGHVSAYAENTKRLNAILERQRAIRDFDPRAELERKLKRLFPKLRVSVRAPLEPAGGFSSRAINIYAMRELGQDYGSQLAGFSNSYDTWDAADRDAPRWLLSTYRKLR